MRYSIALPAYFSIIPLVYLPIWMSVSSAHCHGFFSATRIARHSSDMRHYGPAFYSEPVALSISVIRHGLRIRQVPVAVLTRVTMPALSPMVDQRRKTKGSEASAVS
jgi:hypothetical protein